jgi:hypothetical protein
MVGNSGEGFKESEDYKEKLFDCYKSKSDSFEKSFAILITFSLLLIFVVILPYFSIQLQMHAVSKQIKLIQEDNSTLQTFVQNLNSTLNRVKEQAPRELRSFVLETGAPPDQIVDKAKNQIDVIINTVKKNVTSPLTALHNKSLVQVPILEAKLDKQSQMIKDSITFDDFRTVTGKGQFFGRYTLNTSHTLMNGLHYDVLDKILSQSIGELNQNIGVLKEKEKNIISRISQVQFPFGNIPIGLDELISIFPIILGIGTTICVFTLRDTITFRRDLDEWYQKKLDDNRDRVSDDLSLIAPIWINPIAPKLDQTIKFSILMIMPSIFVLIVIYQISFGWGSGDVDNPFTFPGEREGNLQIFGVLYVIFARAISYSYWKFIAELRNYRRELESH